jgi:hypothetical protein
MLRARRLISRSGETRSLELIINDLRRFTLLFSLVLESIHRARADEIIITKSTAPRVLCHNMLVMRLLNYIYLPLDSRSSSGATAIHVAFFPKYNFIHILLELEYCAPLICQHAAGFSLSAIKY